MAAHRYVVFTNPAPGRENEFNRWYDEVHLGEVLTVPGFTAASRYRVMPDGEEKPEFAYLAIYEIDGDDPSAALDELMRRAQSGELQMSDTLGDVRTMLVRHIVSKEG